MILPCAEAIMSTFPRLAQASAAQNAANSVSAIARPIGEGGVSTISSAAGRKAMPWDGRRRRAAGRAGTPAGARALPDDFMDPRLQAVERGVAPAGADQLVMAAVLDQAPAVQGQNAVAASHRR